jgi:hypothetical protein
MVNLVCFALGVLTGAGGLIGWFALAVWLEDKAERDRHYGPRPSWTDKGTLRRER